MPLKQHFPLGAHHLSPRKSYHLKQKRDVTPARFLCALFTPLDPVLCHFIIRKIGICIININPTRIQKNLLFAIIAPSLNQGTFPFPAPDLSVRQSLTAGAEANNR